MTKLTNTMIGRFTTGVAIAMAVGLAIPAQAMTPAEVSELIDDVKWLESRTQTVGSGLSMTSATGVGSLKSTMLSLELDLQFPAISTSSAASVGDYSSYTLAMAAMTTRDTMLLRACTIAEQAAPPANLRLVGSANVTARANAIQSALRLHAPTARPSRSDLGASAIAQVAAEAEDIMSVLGDYLPMDPDVDASTWYFHNLLLITWQNAVDACEMYSPGSN